MKVIVLTLKVYALHVYRKNTGLYSNDAFFSGALDFHSGAGKKENWNNCLLVALTVSARRNGIILLGILDRCFISNVTGHLCAPYLTD